MAEDWVVLTTYTSEIEANLAVDELEDAGIAACILNPTLGSNYPSLQLTLGIQVAVNGADLDEARKLLTLPEA